MTTQYTRSVLKLAVAQICQTIGWHSVNSTPLEFMVDLMQEYIFQLSKLSIQYAQVLGRCEGNLDDLGLAFRHMNIDLQELSEYIKNVDPVPCAINVPKLPIHRDSHLNFLKPGSREVVTRPVHIHEHLPAMYPENENNEDYKMEIKDESASDQDTCKDSQITNENQFTDGTSETSADENVEITSVEGSPLKSMNSVNNFKRPGDLLDSPNLKRSKLLDEELRPLREIHSVIMTTSGYISTAREGKLPESRTPLQPRGDDTPPSPVRSDSGPSPPEPTSYPMDPPEEKPEKKTKKIKKSSSPIPNADIQNKPGKENKKKKKKQALLQKVGDVKVSKSTLKELGKVKTLKANSKLVQNTAESSVDYLPYNKISSKVESPKSNKNTLGQNKVKLEKGIAGEILLNPMVNQIKEEVIDIKLPIDPDKQKSNILKKISTKPKEEKDFIDLKYKEAMPLKDNMLQKSTSRADNMQGSVLENIDKQFGNQKNTGISDIKIEDKNQVVENPYTNMDVGSPYIKSESGQMNSQNLRGSDFMFDGMSPPGTPSTPKTPEVSGPGMIIMDQKKKKKEKPGRPRKEPKIKTPKIAGQKKTKTMMYQDVQEPMVLDRPRTPQGPEHPMAFYQRDANLQAPLAFPPFLGNFQAAPGFIPRPLFPNPYAPRGMPLIPPDHVMLRHRLLRPNLDKPMGVPPGYADIYSHPGSFSTNPLVMENKAAKKETLDREIVHMSPILQQRFPVSNAPTTFTHPNAPQSSIMPMSSIPAPLTPLPVAPSTSNMVCTPSNPLPLPVVQNPKPDKAEKSEKKSKEHKKEKKDKLKKKKEKKDKHKEKGTKIKEKKDKGEKKDKLAKLKEKKEKKEKRKEKEANKKFKEEKQVESVPKLTLKLGPTNSPRPPTPTLDSAALTTKITIKPPKKPEEELKREPSPELLPAKISALVTRPPKVKSSSKKTEEGMVLETAVSSNTSYYSNRTAFTVDSVPKNKKSIFKAMPPREPSPVPNVHLPSSSNVNTLHSLKPQSSPFIYVDGEGQKIWICPACGKPDDGSSMIGCDDCDAWYHWICVGIQVEPPDVQWYCRPCIVKKQESYTEKKKKKRKKKTKESE